MTREIKSFDILPGWWIAVYIAPVYQPFLWVAEDTFIEFKGYKLLLRPAIEKTYPTVYLNTHLRHVNPVPKEPANIILEFLSSFAWISGQRFEIIGSGASQYPLKHVNCQEFVQPYKHLNFDIIPETADDKSRLALALYREALSITHPAFQFLSFYKIINLLFPVPADQMKWINKSVDLIENHYVKERLQELKEQKEDIGKYLYVSCRCAISHASLGTTVIDPDNYTDYKRVYHDIDLIHELAKLIIRTELHIKSSEDIRKEHLYELAGFKNLFSEQLLKRITNEKEIEDEAFPIIPNLSIRLHGEPKFNVLENLEAHVCGYNSDVIAIKCYSASKHFATRIFLNFKKERLETDWLSPNNVFLGDDMSSSACDNILEFLKFQELYLMNGTLEVWDTKEHKLLGRCDPFIPINCFVDNEWFKEETNKLNQEKERRLLKNK